MKLRIKKQKPAVSERRRPVGNDNPEVFSYYARGNSVNAQNTGRHEKATAKATRSFKRLAYVPSYIALLMIIIAGIYSCWLQPSPRVAILSQEGTVTRTSQEYEEGISEVWRRSVLNQSKLTVNSVKIKAEILAKYNEIQTVKIELPLLGRRPSIIVTPSRPAMQFISSNGMFYVDSTGKVMARITDVTVNKLAPISLVRDETGIAAEAGKNIISKPEAAFLQRLSQQLRVESIEVESITLPSAAANQADVRVAGQKYYVKFSTLTDPRQAVGAYKTVQTKLVAEKTEPREYIDVRVEEKVFYK